MKSKYQDIIDRIEEIRSDKGLSKSKFCIEFGMSSQIYNNFIGAQKSMPSLVLVMGVCEAYYVSPIWLLFGTGEKYIDIMEATYIRGSLSTMEKDSLIEIILNLKSKLREFEYELKWLKKDIKND